MPGLYKVAVRGFKDIGKQGAIPAYEKKIFSGRFLTPLHDAD